MTSIEIRLKNIENLLKKLVEERETEWISEQEATNMIGRGKAWLKNQRLGLGGYAVTLYKDKDWRYVNGRTPEYKRKSIEARKVYMPVRKEMSTTG